MGDYIAYERGLKEGDSHPIINAFNTVGYDAATLGNHEFNYGLDFLEKALAGADFPVVLSNLAKEKGARTLLGQGRAGFRNDPGAGSVVRKRTGDGAPRPRDPRAFGKRRRAPEEAERACSAAAFEAAARRASVGVAASATRPEEATGDGG